MTATKAPSLDPTSREPDAVNAEGTKWWHHPAITQWAQREGAGVPLKDAVGWIVEVKSGDRSFVLTEGQKYLAESTSLEGISVKIDMLRFTRVSAFDRGVQDAKAGKHYVKDNPFDYFKDRSNHQEWRDGYRVGVHGPQAKL